MSGRTLLLLKGTAAVTIVTAHTLIESCLLLILGIGLGYSGIPVAATLLAALGAAAAIAVLLGIMALAIAGIGVAALRRLSRLET